MSETAETKNTKRQGKNVRFARDLRGFSQQDLADKLNKQQSEISKIENQENIDDELLEQIALALDVSADFLRNFDLNEHTKTYNNKSTNTFSDTSHDNKLEQDQIEIEKQEIINNYPIEQFKDFAESTLKLQKELLEEKYTLDKENALLKQELEFLKNKK